MTIQVTQTTTRTVTLEKASVRALAFHAADNADDPEVLQKVFEECERRFKVKKDKNANAYVADIEITSALVVALQQVQK